MKLFVPLISEIFAEPGTKVCVTHFDPRAKLCIALSRRIIINEIIVPLISEIFAEPGTKICVTHFDLRDKALRHVKSLAFKIV